MSRILKGATGVGLSIAISGAALAMDEQRLFEDAPAEMAVPAYPLPETTTSLPNFETTTTLGSVAAVTTTTLPLVMMSSAENYQELIEDDAPLHYIVIPTIKRPELPLTDPRVQILAGLLAPEQNPVLIGQIKQEIATATYDRYIPSSITSVQTPPLDLGFNNCLDYDVPGQDGVIENRAWPYRHDDAINVILVEANYCNQVTLGASRPGDAQILGFDALYDPARITVHEAGHSANVGHAGIIVCASVVTLEGCAPTDETGDKTSIMSYYWDTPHFTAPEFFTMGLLPESQVLSNPKPGQYAIGGIDATDDSYKLLRLDTANGTLNFSWEPDNQAPYDLNCATSPGDNQPGDLISKALTDAAGMTRVYTCRETNLRYQDHTLQTRLQGVDEGMVRFDLLPRPDRQPDPVLPDLSNGEVVNGAVLYQDADYQVIYLGQTENNQGVVQVNRL